MTRAAGLWKPAAREPGDGVPKGCRDDGRSLVGPGFPGSAAPHLSPAPHLGFLLSLSVTHAVPLRTVWKHLDQVVIDLSVLCIS